MTRTESDEYEFEQLERRCERNYVYTESLPNFYRIVLHLDIRGLTMTNLREIVLDKVVENVKMLKNNLVVTLEFDNDCFANIYAYHANLKSCTDSLRRYEMDINCFVFDRDNEPIRRFYIRVEFMEYLGKFDTWRINTDLITFREVEDYGLEYVW